MVLVPYLVVLSAILAIAWIVAEFRSDAAMRITLGGALIVSTTSAMWALKDLANRVHDLHVSRAFRQVSSHLKAQGDEKIHAAIERYLDKVQHDPSSLAANELSVELNPTGAPCIAGRGDLVCVNENFAYARYYEELWSILHARADEVKACSSESTVVNFLELVQHLGDAEFAEFYGGTIETLAIDHPRCLALGWSNLAPHVQDAVVEALDAPLFTTPEAIAAAARSARVPEDFAQFAQAMGW